MRIKKYLNTKTFSRILAFGILLNSVPINSFAGILSEDGRYETFEGSDITVNNILEEDKVDVEVEGNTLINMYRPDTLNTSKDGISKYTSKFHTGFKHIVTSPNDNQRWVYPAYEMTYHFKDNTTYSIIMNITKNTFTHNQTMRIFRPESTTTTDEVRWLSGGKTGLVVTSITTNSNSAWEWNSIYNFGLTISEVGELIVEDIMILEGDWTNKEIPIYFEGMKSVGELENNNLEIKSQTKNLLDLSTLKQGGINPENGEDYDINFNDRVRSEFIKVKPNTKYSINSYNRTFEYDENKKFIKSFSNAKKFTTTSKTHYLRFHATPSIGEFQPNTQLEEGDSFTTPTKHASKVLTINLSQPLRSLPNGVKDRIIKRNGQWVVERNCEEVMFDGSDDEIWCYKMLESSGKYSYGIYNVLKGYPDYKPNGVSDKFTFINWNNNPWNYRNNCISAFRTDVLVYTDFATLAEFKTWLQSNPFTLIYELPTPRYEPLKTEPILNLYTETTYMSTNSIIPANLKITIDRVANRAKEYSELAQENPTIENISLARMWTNKMRESILKDEFQDNIDTITEITDMTLERKTASANLDVYIKSENMLSMNLSTNSITFDDFSGVEDMTKENAVNISINSSLPYNLNAYLATEIQNGDKSNTMNKDILSIKDNSELDYQTFSNTIDKVVLKSNCNSGNDKQHDINLKLNGGIAHEKDVYKTTIKFEAEQQ